MQDRTTVSVDEPNRDAAREVKDEYGESWNDVIRFYAEHRDEVSLYQDDRVRDTLDDELAQEIINCIGAEVGGPAVDSDKLAREFAAAVDYAELSQKVADELEGRLR